MRLELNQLARPTRPAGDPNGGLSYTLELVLPGQAEPLPFNMALERLGLPFSSREAGRGLRKLGVNYLADIRGNPRGLLGGLRFMVQLGGQQDEIERLLLSTEPLGGSDFSLFEPTPGMDFVNDLSEIATTPPPFLARATLFRYRNLPAERGHQGVLVVSRGLVHPPTPLMVGFRQNETSR